MDTGTTFFTAQARTRCQQKADSAGFGGGLGEGRLFKETMKRLAAGPCHRPTKLCS